MRPVDVYRPRFTAGCQTDYSCFYSEVHFDVGGSKKYFCLN